jgi:FKBP-type peptidyl-prolyl cis-trans isomerase FkpA
MNMIKFATVLLGVLLVMGGCQNEGKEKQTPGGFKFVVLKEGDGIPPKKFDVIVYNLITKDSKDSVWSNTYTKGIPGIFFIKDSTEIAKEDGFLQMFRMVSKGDSVRIKMPVKTLFKDYVKIPIPKGVDSTLDVSYIIKVEDIMDEPKFRDFQTNLMEKKRTQQKGTDDTLIKEYLTKNNVQAEKDTSGVYYVIHDSKGKEKPTDASCVTVAYKGALLESGKVFDRNEKLSFSLNQVIPGWRIAIPKLGIGDSATFFIPSELAYGPRGAQGAIPPDAVLTFDVRLIEIGKEVDQKTGNCK